jgi:hypothetical protein
MSQDENDAVFTAGQVVAPGTYQRIDIPGGRQIDLHRAEALPGSLDGTVALYRRIVPREVGAKPTEGDVTTKRLVAID